MQLFLVILLLVSCSLSQAQEDVNHLELAKMLIRDGNYVRGEKSLSLVKSDDQEDLALVEFLWALISLSQKKYNDVIRHGEKSLSLGLESREIYLYMAEASLNQKKLNQAMTYLQQISIEHKKQLPYFLIAAEIRWQQGQKVKAWQWLDRAMELKLDKNIIGKKKFSYFIAEKLYQSAYLIASQQLHSPSHRQDVLAMASQLRQERQHLLALTLLQSLKIMEPDNERVALELAQVYLNEKKTYSAALVMEEAAKHNSSLAYEAGELLRQVGKSYRAEWLNLSIEDPEKNLKQKIALYLQDDNYHSLTYLLPQLKKYKLIENQKIRYALSYALFRTGKFKRAVKMLSPINEDGLFEKTVELKREIQKCQNEEWSCVETI